MDMPPRCIRLPLIFYPIGGFQISVMRKRSSELVVLNEKKTLQSNNQVGISTDELKAVEHFSNNILETHRGILSRLMPSEADSQVEKFKASLIEIQATSRLDLFRQYKEFQRQSLKDALDVLLVRGKEELRGETTKSFAFHHSELAKEVTELVDEFLEEFEQKLEKAEETKNEKIRETRIQMLNNRIAEFTQTVDLLMERFSDIIKEGV